MPQRVEVVERYRCPGRWPWQWFRTCTRTATKWCYRFQWVTETGYLFSSKLEGCEDGTKYCWTDFSFGIVGSTTYHGIEKCFNSEITKCGNCH